MSTIYAAGSITYGTTSVVPSMPTTYVDGDLLVLFVGAKRYDIVLAGIPAGWTFQGSSNSGTTTTTNTSDAGDTVVHIYTKTASGTETLPAITAASNGQVMATRVFAIQHDGGATTWDVAFAGGKDTTATTDIVVPYASNPGIIAGDTVLVFNTIRTDTVGTWTAAALNGMTMGSEGTPSSSLGVDIGGRLWSIEGVTADITGPVTFTATSTSATTIVASGLLRVRGTGIVTPPPVDPPPAADALTPATWPAFIVDAHQSGSTSTPENTFEAAASAYASGIRMIDLDARFTSDNVVVVMHDDDVSRTTNGTGSVPTMTAAQVRALRVNGGKGWAPGWGLLTIPLATEMLDLYGNKAYMTIEAKDEASIPTLAGLVKARGLAGSVYINSNRLTDAAVVHQNGCLFHFWSSASSADITAAANAGVDLVNVGVGLADSVFATARDSTIPKILATDVPRRSKMARVKYLAANYRVNGYISDDPVYVGEAIDKTPDFDSTASRLAAQKFGVGWFAYTSVATVRPTITTTGKIRFPGGSRNGVLLGDMGSTTAPSSYSLRYAWTWTTAPSDPSYSALLRFASPTDGVWSGSGVGEDGGYTVNAHYSGLIELFMEPVGGGTSVLIGSVDTGAPVTVGTRQVVRVDVTPTTIKMVHETTGATSSLITDTTMRGGYLHVGKSGTNAAGALEMDTVERVALAVPAPHRVLVGTTWVNETPRVFQAGSWISDTSRPVL